jgi:hypothetical protein
LSRNIWVDEEMHRKIRRKDEKDRIDLFLRRSD